MGKCQKLDLQKLQQFTVSIADEHNSIAKLRVIVLFHISIR